MSDRTPGIRRRRAGRGFLYSNAAGDRISDPQELRRIRSIVIPPAWTEVWICPRSDGHLQAVGRDARGRKQYRYHPRWRDVRDRTKYDRMIAFGRALPKIRRRLKRDLALPGLPRAKVLATVASLLESSQFRVGNNEYVRQNASYGLTTLRNRHVEISGSRLRFRFRGKSGKIREVALSDFRLARIVRRCREIPGQELFQYVDESGQARAIGSGDVNDYLREISGDDFTAKGFRTWSATVLAYAALRRLGPAASQAEARRNVVTAIAEVADRLGNTPAVSRKSYIHPAVIDGYLNPPDARHAAVISVLRAACSVSGESPASRPRSDTCE